MEKIENIIDTSGYCCPITLAMVSRKLKGLEIGDTLKVISDDPDFKIWSLLYRLQRDFGHRDGWKKGI